MTRENIVGKIHPNNRKLLPEEVFVEDVSPFDLLFHPKRFDAMVKYVYANHRKLDIDSDWAKRMYIDHLSIIAPGYKEGDGIEKAGVHSFLTVFGEIMASVAAEGFDREKSIIPVNDEGVIVDGAHRLAACAAYDRKVTVVRPALHHKHDYSSYWFLEHGFPRRWVDAVVTEYCRINKNSYVAILWPKAVGSDREIRDALSSVGRVYYEKKVTLRRNGPANFMKLVYGQHHWIGSWADGYLGAVGAAGAYFGGKTDIRVFVFDAASPELVLKAKRAIREFFGIGNYSIHINDTHEETIAVSQALLNENSVHFLNYASLKETDSYHAMAATFRESLAAQSASPESFCVDSSMVLAAYGVREARDLDVLHHGQDDVVSRFPPGIGSHNQEARHYSCSLDDVIFNPERHFYTNGVKYAALEVVCEMKRRRGEKKDVRDLELVRRFLEVEPARSTPTPPTTGSPVGLRDRIREVMPSAVLSFYRRVRYGRDGASTPGAPKSAVGAETGRGGTDHKVGVDFTGIVVTYNEVTYLEECLRRLEFCREIIVVDMGSTDGSVQVAEKMGARIVRHERAPVVEMVRGFAAAQAGTDWIVFMDPDLMFPSAALQEIGRAIETTPDIGMIEVPYRNHFMKEPLHFGRWGGIGWYPAILHRERVGFQNEVHRGIRLKPGYKSHRIAGAEASIITHYWADTWPELTLKAERYLGQEGIARLGAGERTNPLRVLWSPARAFLQSFFGRKGVRGGWTGLKLSLFWAWYSYRSELALLQHMRREPK
jgi:cellulose synthase/poly-beta-1,6-N-acetylglucosamine synthase-like glycosyltransferase